VAIVGSRSALRESSDFAFTLAAQLARANITVVSGGALGIDAAAHEGALSAGGSTWVVCPTGKDVIYPPEHASLFGRVQASATGRLIWPFPAPQLQSRESFLYRNSVLVALSEALVVVQARYKSGSRNAVTWARKLARPVWAMTAAPWMTTFCGSNNEIERGRARPLLSAAQLLRELGVAQTPDQREFAFGVVPSRTSIAPTPETTLPLPHRTDLTKLTESEQRVVACFEDGSRSAGPHDTRRFPRPTAIHLDAIVIASSLSPAETMTALLTLSLKNVVVEGPSGFFRLGPP